MEVRVCKRCKKMYQHIPGPSICPQCKKKEEEMFQVDKEYLRKHPGASMQEVSVETETPVALVEGFLRQGRLQVSPDSPISITCEQCGTKIFTGRFCNKCSNQVIESINDLAKELNAAKQPKPQEDAAHTARMRFLKSDQIK